MKFGGRGTATTDVEADEACIQSWSVCVWETPEGGGEQVQAWYHYFFVVLGIRLRGDMSKFWLRFVMQGDLPVGVTRCRGPNKRLPPVSQDFWLACAQDAFSEDANVVLHTDQNVTYQSCTPRGVIQHFTVDHSEKEFARSVMIIKRVGTDEKRKGITGTMTVDRAWRSLKGYAKQSGTSCKTEAGRRRMMRKIRAAQWKCCVSTEDRWPSFCQAARAWANARPEQASPDETTTTGATGEVGDLDPATLQNLPEADEEPDTGAEEDLLKEASRQAWGSRFFEKQAGAACGQHALNNLLGGPVYTAANMASACDAVLASSSDPQGASEHRRGAGWYSHSVLGKALDMAVPPAYRMLSEPASVSDWDELSSGGNVIGAIVNVRNAHWCSVVHHDGCVFYVDSMQFPPVLIEREEWRSILTEHPTTYLVCCANHERPRDAQEMNELLANSSK